MGFSLVRCYTIYNVLCNVWDSALRFFKMNKYSVLFEHRNNSMYVTIANDLSIEDAVQFALNLHRSSNNEHVITVCKMVDYGNVSVLELSKGE